MPCCYILYSSKINKFYIGSCDDFELRLLAHNQGKYGSSSYSHITNDWQLYLKINTVDFSHAVRLERKIKKMKSRKHIENLRKYPELIEKIIVETST